MYLLPCSSAALDKLQPESATCLLDTALEAVTDWSWFFFHRIVMVCCTASLLGSWDSFAIAA